jgi:hypothetical protein
LAASKYSSYQFEVRRNELEETVLLTSSGTCPTLGFAMTTLVVGVAAKLGPHLRSHHRSKLVNINVGVDDRQAGQENILAGTTNDSE